VNEIERSVWEQHDRRLNEHEVRFNQGTKDFTEIKEALKQLTERINEGVSKTQQRILEKHQGIELAVNNLSHAVELSTEKMNTKIDNVHNQLLERLDPLEKAEAKKDRLWWLLLGAVVLVTVTVLGTRMIDRLWPKEVPPVTQIENLKARPVR
jgi:hypothetical protein